MKYIAMTFPLSAYWQPEAPYHGNINKFIIGGISPKTVTGEVSVTLTTYEDLERFIAAEHATGNEAHPDYVDFMKQLVNDGVTLLPDYPLSPKIGSFKLAFFIRLTPNAYENGLMPVGSHQSVGTGAVGDAAEGAQRTWQQWVNATREGNVSHENETHKFVAYYTFGVSQPTHDEYAALLNHTASGFKVVSPNEYIAQRTEDQPA
jgi:hypothetical protein